MKNKLTLTFISLFTILFIFPSFAQDLPKEEAKVWKDKLKAFYGQYKKDLGGFKRFIEDKDAAEAQVPKLESEVNRLNDKQRQQSSEIDNLRSENSILNQQLKDLENNANSGGGKPSPSSGGVPSTGVAFTVQVSAASAGVKYMIGIFDNYPQAQTMRDSLRKMGVKDTFIIAYKDGSEVPVADVMNGAGNP